MSADFPDKKRAILRAPLHVLLSVPFAAASLAVPKVGKWYLGWRKQAETDDYEQGRDSLRKSQVDLATQTFLVKGPVWLWNKLGR